jgi:type II secretory pathway predicted ATPase ExeA
MWLQFYGLNKQPFGVTPDPSFLYMGPAHQEAFASMVYGIETGCGFMAVIASPGMGKTTLVLRLMEKLRESALTAFLFQMHSNSQEFLKNLLLDLDVKPTGQDMSDLQRQVREVLMRSAHAGKRMVLVIDEAQNLDDSVLEMVRMLSNFETPHAKLLQTILVGQPALADKLAHPHLSQLRQRISIIAHFPPLRDDEVEKYIAHRLRVAGYKGNRLFTPAAMDLIVRYSGGIPRIINNLCFNAMSLSFAKGKRKIDESTLMEVVSDLSLESLRDPRGTGPSRASRPAPVREGGKRNRANSQDPDLGSQPWATGGEFMDSVDLSGSRRVWAKEPVMRPLYSSHEGYRSGYKISQRAQLLIFLAVATVLVWGWRAPWIKPSADFIVQAVQNTLGGSETQVNPPARIQAEVAVSSPVDVARKPEERSSQDSLSGGIKSGSSQSAEIVPENAHGSASSAASPVAGTGVLTPVSEGADLNLSSRMAGGQSVSSAGKRSAIDDMGTRGVTGQLIVQANMSGARVSINGRYNPKWVTPRLFSLVAGTYNISVSKGGYIAWTRRVHVDKGGEQWVTADLKYDEGAGIFIVDTEPSGMQVFIDGKPYGASRVETTLAPGWHAYEVHPGYGVQPVLGHFHLKSGEALTKRIRVTPGESSGTPSTLLRPSGAEPSGSISSTTGRLLE